MVMHYIPIGENVNNLQVQIKGEKQYRPVGNDLRMHFPNAP
jgi:hypothetical protein